MVSFFCNIEDLSALDAPLIDSINWNRVAANNNSFFVSGSLPIIVGSHKPKMTTVGGDTHIIHHASFCLRRKCDEAHQTRSSANKKTMLALYCCKDLQKILLRTCEHGLPYVCTQLAYGMRERFQIQGWDFYHLWMPLASRIGQHPLCSQFFRHNWTCWA